ncbi:MAG: amino acid adenylation domain-containing protein [Oscillospiraceae bacterium]|nr:amino acid adenylation domain-containing protein [Oscillospiraceae bacterium]
MSDVKRVRSFPLNRSEYGIYMNERAFPGSPINTIGYMLRFPTIAPENLHKAADSLIDAVPAFRSGFAVENGEPVIYELTAPPQRCRLSDTPMTVWEASDIWERRTTETLDGGMYDMQVFPLKGGGSVLMARFHHIILDGYDMCKTVRFLLDVLSGKQPEPMAFAHAEDRALNTEEERAFWLEYFYDAQYEPFIMQETTDSNRRKRLRCQIGSNASGRIRTFARAHDVTPAAVFSAALSLYLARATDKHEAVFIMPRLGRSTPEERAAYGCHTEAIPVRCAVDDAMTFPELCKKALEQGRKASAHKAYGIGNILSDLKNAGLVNGAASEYTLNFYNVPIPSDIPYEIDMSVDGAMHNHLTMNIMSFQGNFEVFYDMRDGIYDAKRTQRFHEAILSLIAVGTSPANASRRIGTFGVLGTAEQELLSRQEGKTIALDERATIPSLFRNTAQRYPDRIALYAGDAAYTFTELDTISNRVANALLSMGVQQGQTVMYKLRRDEKLIPVMLGILKAGAAFIPIDPAYPQGRIDYIQQNSGSAMMVVNDPDAESSEVRQTIHLLSADELLTYEDAHDPMCNIRPEQLAYCIYTSGTTGKPKGAMLSHKGIVNITHPDNNPVNRDIARCGKGICAIGSVCFDISLFEFFVPMFSGMFIEFAPECAMTDPEPLAALIKRHGSNMIHCTPSRLTAYLNNASFMEVLDSIEVILVAGERVPKSLVDELRDRYGIRIYNGYGPTETTIGATITEAGDNYTIGRPIANTGIMILDSMGRMVPYGAIGEIYIYGAGLGMGYKNLPVETVKRFVTHYGIPMYKTGDLGRFLEDGRVVYHGRNDFQVKIRGLRIELSEIENCIRSYEGIANVLVQVRRINSSEHLVAFYTVKEGMSVRMELLKEHVKHHLTLYMVPDIFKELPEFPQTPGGKTDIRAFDKIPLVVNRVYRAPENEFQAVICRAFAKTLRVKNVGITDSFYDLGGDSLHTAEVVHCIESELPVTSIAYEDIFKYPTPEMLAQYLYLKQAEKSRKTDNPLEKLNYDGLRALLSRNTVEGKPERHRLGNVLLTGVTGFLGIHVLAALLRQPELWDNIWCLARPSRRQSPEQRLKSTLFYFEENDCSEYLGKNLFAVPGDITEETIFDQPFTEHLDTVINCAANVSHFGFDDTFDRINVRGVMHLLELCKKHGAELVQASTISVGGVYEAGSTPLTLTERDLFVGQEIRNQYIRSKYMAEYYLLRAAADEGVPVKLMRVGNLQGRITDGEFQMNRQRNAFTRQIASYVKIRMLPESIYRSSVNFSPVDDVARMIVELSTLPEQYSVFHVYPPEEVSYAQLFRNLQNLGQPIDVVSDDEFEKAVAELQETETGREQLEGLFVERPDLRFRWTAADDSFTREMLGQLGLSWHEISDEYLTKYFRALEELGMFDMDM